jgi:hypothetical protein
MKKTVPKLVFPGLFPSGPYILKVECISDVLSSSLGDWQNATDVQRARSVIGRM